MADLCKVKARFTFAKGESAGPSGFGSSSNSLLLYQRPPGAPLRFNLLVESRAQRVALDNLLRRWRQPGLDVVAGVF